MLKRQQGQDEYLQRTECMGQLKTHSCQKQWEYYYFGFWCSIYADTAK